MKTAENTVYRPIFQKNVWSSLYRSKSKNYTDRLFIFPLIDWLLWLLCRVAIIYISRMRLRLRRLCCCCCGVWWWGPLSEDPELLFSSLAPLQAKGDNLNRFVCCDAHWTEFKFRKKLSPIWSVKQVFFKIDMVFLIWLISIERDL